VTILFETDTSSAELMALAIGGKVTAVDGMPAVRRALSDDPMCDLVVVGPSVDIDAALEFASAERVHRPALGVILVRRRIDTTVMSQALRAGVREVVGADDLTALGDACRRSVEVSRHLRGAAATEHSAGASKRGQLITVFAAKGGCGKTTVATNVAAALAAGGKSSVCLVDLDLAFGDVAIALQLFPARTVADALGLASLDETAVRSLLTPHSPGLDAIVAPVEPGTAESISGAVVGELLRVLKTMFDHVVVDSPPAFTDHVLASFDESDHLVLLATLDIPALKNLKLTLETLDMLAYSRDRWHVVLNRSDAKVGLSVADVSKTLKTDIAAQIPSSRAVPAAINRGVPIVLDEPGHAVSQAIKKFAATRLVNTNSPTIVPELRKDRRGFPLRRKGVPS
jgi:pilus assembly protein CpaE